FPDLAMETRGQFNALAQALRNFLQNAQEAIAEQMRNTSSSQTRKAGEIRIHMRAEDDWIMIEIEDNGAGFDPGIGERIYDPMYTTKNSDLNPGLGLTVALQIIRD